MSLFGPRFNSFMERANNWMTPERAIAMQGIGQGLSQMSMGQAPNLSPAYNALMKRQQNAQMRETLQGSGIMERFTPEQQQLLAQMEPSAAQKIIAQALFAPAPQGTDDMREYNFARSQGYQGTFNDYMTGLRTAGATKIDNNLGPSGVDYGDPPPDMAWVRNADNTVKLDERGAPVAVVIRGSKTDRQQTQDLLDMAGGAIDEAEADAAADEAAAQTNQVVSEDIDRALELARSSSLLSPVAGFLGDMLQDVGGTRSANFKQLTMSIRANIGFDRLQAMREASPTGGALGNVTIGELERLEAVLGSLSQKQDTPQLVDNLERLDQIYSDIMAKAAAYPNASDFGFAPADGAGAISVPDFGAMSDEELDAWIKENG